MRAPFENSQNTVNWDHYELLCEASQHSIAGMVYSMILAQISSHKWQTKYVPSVLPSKMKMLRPSITSDTNLRYQKFLFRSSIDQGHPMVTE
jgi:hypothetical protein